MNDRFHYDALVDDALRSVVRWLMLDERCLTDFLARLAACLVLAMFGVSLRVGLYEC